MATRGRSPQDGWRVSQLRFESRIGVGSHGQIFRATDQVGGVHVVKVLSRDDPDTNIEVAALRRVQRHPNVISLDGPVEYSAESAFVVLEHCDSDLLELVLASGGRGLPVEQAQYFFAQLVKALRHCHHKGVCHGDLKPENALIKGPVQGGVLKLCDFGSASLHRRATRAAGSIIYSSPEVLPLFHLHGDATPVAPGADKLRHRWGAPVTPSAPPPDGQPQQYDAAAADMWSLGVVLFVLLAGRPPFSEASLYDAEFVRLVRGTFAYPASFPAPAVALLRHLLAVRPRDRWSVSDVYRDHWVTPLREARDDLRRTMTTALSFRALGGLPDDSSAAATPGAASVDAPPGLCTPNDASVAATPAAAPSATINLVDCPSDVAAFFAEHARRRRADKIRATDSADAYEEARRRRHAHRQRRRKQSSDLLEQKHTPLMSGGGTAESSSLSRGASEVTPGSDATGSTAGADASHREDGERRQRPLRRRHHSHYRSRRAHVADVDVATIGAPDAATPQVAVPPRAMPPTSVPEGKDDAEAGHGMAAVLAAAVFPDSSAAAAVTATAALSAALSMMTHAHAVSPSELLVTGRLSRHAHRPPRQHDTLAVGSAVELATSPLQPSGEGCRGVDDTVDPSVRRGAAATTQLEANAESTHPSAASAFMSEASAESVPADAHRAVSSDAIAALADSSATVTHIVPPVKIPTGVGAGGGGSRLVSYLTQSAWPPTLHQLQLQQQPISPILARQTRRTTQRTTSALGGAVTPSDGIVTPSSSSATPLVTGALTAISHPHGSSPLRTSDRVPEKPTRSSASASTSDTASDLGDRSAHPAAASAPVIGGHLSAIKAAPGWENQASASSGGHLSPFTPHLMGGSEYAASDSSERNADMQLLGVEGLSASAGRTSELACAAFPAPPETGPLGGGAQSPESAHFSGERGPDPDSCGQAASSLGQSLRPPPKLLFLPKIDSVASDASSAPSSGHPTPANLGGAVTGSASGSGASSVPSGPTPREALLSGRARAMQRRQLSLHRAASGHQFSDTSRLGLLRPPERRLPLHGPASPEVLPTTLLEQAASTAAALEVSTPDHRLLVATGPMAPVRTPDNGRDLTPGQTRGGYPGSRRASGDSTAMPSVFSHAPPFRSVSPALPSPPASSSSSASATSSRAAGAADPQGAQGSTSPAPRRRSDSGSSSSSLAQRDDVEPDLPDAPAGHGEAAQLVDVEALPLPSVTGALEPATTEAKVPESASLSAPLSAKRSSGSVGDDEGGFAVVMYAGSGAGGTTGIIKRVAPAAQVRYLRLKERVKRPRSISENNVLVVLSRRHQLRGDADNAVSRAALSPPPPPSTARVGDSEAPSAGADRAPIAPLTRLAPIGSGALRRGGTVSEHGRDESACSSYAAPPPGLSLRVVSTARPATVAVAPPPPLNSAAASSSGAEDARPMMLRIGGAAPGGGGGGGGAPGGLRILGSRASVTVSLRSDDEGDDDDEGLDAATVMATLAKAAEERRAASRASSRAASEFAYSGGRDADRSAIPRAALNASRAESRAGSATSDLLDDHDQHFLQDAAPAMGPPTALVSMQPWQPPVPPSPAAPPPPLLGLRIRAAAPAVPAPPTLAPSTAGSGATSTTSASLRSPVVAAAVPQMRPAAPILFISAATHAPPIAASQQPISAGGEVTASTDAAPLKFSGTAEVFSAPSIGLHISAPRLPDDHGLSPPLQHPPLHLPARFQAPPSELDQRALAAGIVLGQGLWGVEILSTPAESQELLLGGRGRERRGSMSSWGSADGDSVLSSNFDDDDRSSVASESSSQYYEDRPEGAAAAAAASSGATGYPSPGRREATAAPPHRMPSRHAGDWPGAGGHPPRHPPIGGHTTTARGILGVRNVVVAGFARARLLDDDEEAGVELEGGGRRGSDDGETSGDDGTASGSSSSSSSSEGSGSSRSDGGGAQGRHARRASAAAAPAGHGSGSGLLHDDDAEAASPPVDPRLLGLR